MATKYTKWPQNISNIPLQGRPNFTQIGIFGLKICHLATLDFCMQLHDAD
jgi:hypothetical protein